MFLLSPEDERFLKRSQSFVRYGFAALMDRFGLDPARIAPLTDRQILQFYFHPRDKDGSLKVDAVEALEDTKPETFDEAMFSLDVLRHAVKLTDENYSECVAKLKKKFGREGT